MKKFIRYFLGGFFIIIGGVGLFLPILQGILFLIVGLLILAPESKTIQKILEKLRKKFPAIFLKSAQLKKSMNHDFIIVFCVKLGRVSVVREL